MINQSNNIQNKLVGLYWPKVDLRLSFCCRVAAFPLLPFVHFAALVIRYPYLVFIQARCHYRVRCENGGAKVGHGSGGIVLLRAV